MEGHGRAAESRPPSDAELVLRMHDALLPKALPVVPGVEVAARYLLTDVHIGGDWFDAVPLGDGRVALAVGDVVGDGVEASAAMGALRTVFEDHVRADADLAGALRALERRARRSQEARATTICAAVLDPATAELHYCTAGHPPPLRVDRTGRTSYLPTSGAVPLGCGEGDFPILTHRMAPGELVLLYSDGLVERPGRTPGQGFDDLRRAVTDAMDDSRAGPRDPLPDVVCGGALERLARATGYADDATVLAVRLVDPVAPLHLRLPAVPDAVRTARADFGDWLAGLHVSVLDDLSVRHAVGELVTNAVEHAYDGPGVQHEVRVTGVLGPDGVLEVEVADDGHWRARSDTPGHRGRGLAMVRGFMDDLAVERDDRGTRVTIRHLLTRPAAMLRGVPVGRSGATGLRDLRLDADGARVVVTGDLDHDGAGELRRAMGLASQGGTRALVVDLTGVRLLSSAAVQALLDARTHGEVDLVAPVGSAAREVLDLVGLAVSAAPDHR